MTFTFQLLEMAHLTQQQLEHLQKLSNIQLDQSEQDKFLQKLDPVIAKLDELWKLDLSNTSWLWDLSNTLRIIKDTNDFPNKKEIINNVDHEVINNSIVVKSVI